VAALGSIAVDFTVECECLGRVVSGPSPQRIKVMGVAPKAVIRATASPDHRGRHHARGQTQQPPGNVGRIFAQCAVLPRGERYGAILVPFFRSSGAAT